MFAGLTENSAFRVSSATFGDRQPALPAFTPWRLFGQVDGGKGLMSLRVLVALVAVLVALAMAWTELRSQRAGRKGPSSR